MKEKLKKAWKWLNGKKTNIGMGMVIVAQGIQVFFPKLIPPEQLDYIQMVGALIGGFGLAHKGMKDPTLQKWGSHLTKQKKK